MPIQRPPAASPRAPALTEQSLYANDAWRPALVLSALTQVPVALGDVFAGRALRLLAHGEPLGRDVLALAACHTLPSLLQAFSAVQAASWRAQSSRGVVDGITRHVRGQTARWVEGRPREGEHAHRMANDVPWVLGMLVGIAPKRAEAMGALAVQAVLIGLLLDPVVAVSLVGALVAAWACGQMSDGGDVTELARSKRMTVPYSDTSTMTEDVGHDVENQVLAGEEPHLLFGRFRNRYWDNVTLGNAYNFSRWHKDFAAITAIFDDDALRREQSKTKYTALSGLISGLVVGGTLAGYAHVLHRRGEHEKLVTVFFPLVARAASIVGQAQDLMGTHQDMVRHERIFTRLLGETQADARLKLLDKVSSDLKIADAHGRAYSTGELLQRPPARGRLTVRDHNGRGKSMFAAALKQAHGPAAWLLPATHALLFGSQSGSSGETAMANLTALKTDLERYPAARILVLDEWDANLDARNRQLASGWIDALAATHLVVEITHAPVLPTEQTRHA